MQAVQRLQVSNQLKLLSDPRRLAILRRLMSGPATLTQLGQAMGEHPAWVRHHLVQLEAGNLVELCSEQVNAGHVEKYYRACSRSYLIQELVLPEPTDRPLAVLSGSHDLALELLAEQVAPLLDVLILPVGSLDGLVALRQGLCQVAGCHLYDSPSGEYNLPYVRHLFPDKPTHLVTLAHRQQGLITAAGNPKQVRGLADLMRSELRFINRIRGSGTRLWLDEHLRHAGISPEQVNGYQMEVVTHTQVAAAVRDGLADVGLGIQAVAQLAGLYFIPLFQERFDLVFRQEQADNPAVTMLMDNLCSSRFRHKVEGLRGYEIGCTGQEWQVM